MVSTAIKNANIFNGRDFVGTGTIVIKDGLITDKTSADTVIDGTGCTLLPGLIDTHVHLYDRVDFLEMAAKNGITTMFDMGTRDPETVGRMRKYTGHTKILSAFNIGCAPDSKATIMMGYPDTALIKSADDAIRFVNDQLSYGADYIKLILEEPGRNGGVAFPMEIATAVIAEAHKHHKLVVTHAVTVGSFKTGVEIGVDVLTHIPFDAQLPQDLVDTIAEKKIVCIPTLVMMQAILERMKKMAPQIPFSMQTVINSVAALYKVGVQIFAGTDSNLDDPLTPASVPYGTGLHDELALLVDAGLTPMEALKSATSGPADYFGLHDRGVIDVGRCADLLLVEGDPTSNINDIRNVKTVWINGVPVKL